MKVNIGPYTGDIIPVYGWEKRYEYWRTKSDTFFLPEEEYTKFDKFVFGFFDKLNNLVRPLNRWSNNRKRKVKVRVDYYDVWSADHTLAMIIHPVLVKLKEQKHGSPVVDDEDVPENLRANKKDHNNLSEEDSTIHERWSWVLDEMIWTFSQHALQDDTGVFYHNIDQLEITPTATDDTKKLYSVGFTHQKDPTKPPYWRDDEGLKKHHERKENGRRLFAKYYENLWD
jgi:hypothetical protein